MEHLKPHSPAPPGRQQPYPEVTSTGTIPFSYEPTGLKGETAYWLWGSLSSKKTPLICLHGGPGMAHDYILPACLIYSNYDIPVLMYDQVGCGKSTHFPEKNGDGSFWPVELFMAELDNVIAHFGIKEFDLFGQSWGGMLAGQYAISQPKGIRKLIIEGGPEDMSTYLAAGQRQIAGLPKEVRETIKRCEAEGKIESKEYLDAQFVYYAHHICRVIPFPDELMAAFDQVEQDPTVYHTMFGPNEFLCTGHLRNWSIKDQLHKITEKTVPGGLLLMNGRYDSVADDTTDGFFWNTKCKVKWVQYALSSHVLMLEETEKSVKDLGTFLTLE